MKSKFVSLLFVAVSLLAISGCDLTGLARNKSQDNRVTNITINEGSGEAFYLDDDGWTWIVDMNGVVIDGPFDLEGSKDPQAPRPEFPNPPPPIITPEPQQGSVGWLLALFVLLGAGCTTRNTFHGNVGTVRIDSGTKANASASISAYARGSSLETEATEAASKEDGQTWIDTQGGGEVAANANTKVGQGNDSQAIEADGVEDVAE